MPIRRRWEIQGAFHDWPLQLGFHIDHGDPSITLHLPCLTMCIGRCKVPGLANDRSGGWRWPRQHTPKVLGIDRIESYFTNPKIEPDKGQRRKWKRFCRRVRRQNRKQARKANSQPPDPPRVDTWKTGRPWWSD